MVMTHEYVFLQFTTQPSKIKSQFTIMLFVTLFKGLISRGPLDLKVCLLLIGCCLVLSFVQDPFCFEEVGLSLFLVQKTEFLRFHVGFSEFWNSLHKSYNKSEESHNKLQKYPFSEWKKVTIPSNWNWRGFCTKLDIIDDQSPRALHVQCGRA